MGLSATNRAQAGVSLAELLAALALALALALLIWPKFVRSKLAANEAAAVGTMKEISQAELTYAATYPASGFAEHIEQLGGREEGCVPRPERACLLDASIADAPHVSRGYVFSAEGAGTGSKTAFLSLAVPVKTGETGQLSFCTTNRWIVHYRGAGHLIDDSEGCEASAVLR